MGDHVIGSAWPLSHSSPPESFLVGEAMAVVSVTSLLMPAPVTCIELCGFPFLLRGARGYRVFPLGCPPDPTDRGSPYSVLSHSLSSGMAI